MQYVVRNPNNITLGQIVQRIINQNVEVPQEALFYMHNNILMNSPIEIDKDTIDLVESGDLLINVFNNNIGYNKIMYIVDYMQLNNV